MGVRCWGLGKGGAGLELTGRLVADRMRVRLYCHYISSNQNRVGCAEFEQSSLLLTTADSKKEETVLPFLPPPHVRASARNISNAHVIEAVGLGSDEVSGIIIDSKVAMEQIHPTYSIALLPLSDDVVVTFADARFYADCFAYEHEIPCIALPNESDFRKSGITFAVSKEGKRRTRESYFGDLCMAMECINSSRLGPLSWIKCRYDTSRRVEPLKIDYTLRYQQVAEAVSLYSLALRQIDPYSEYLCYYRVIENMTASNGKNWLEQNLSRLLQASFGRLQVGDDGLLRRLRKPNLFVLFKRRAIKRLNELQATRSNAKIVDLLYKTNRCGIAHGQSIRHADFDSDFREVSLDCFIVKMMARLAIDDKLPC